MIERPRWRRLLLALVLAGAVVLGGWAWWSDRRFKSAMEEVESEILAGRYEIACQKLNSLSEWKADSNGRIMYLLGSCELARGRDQAAAEAWARIVPGTAFYEKAIQGRMGLYQQSGQLAAEEQLVSDAALDPRTDRTALLVSLVPILSELGRTDEAAPRRESLGTLEFIGRSSPRARHPTGSAARRPHLDRDRSSRPWLRITPPQLGPPLGERLALRRVQLQQRRELLLGLTDVFLMDQAFDDKHAGEPAERIEPKRVAAGMQGFFPELVLDRHVGEPFMEGRRPRIEGDCAAGRASVHRG